MSKAYPGWIEKLMPLIKANGIVPSRDGGSVTSTPIRGLLTDENIRYLQNQPQRPTPLIRFNPANYIGQYVYDPATGRMVFKQNQ